MMRKLFLVPATAAALAGAVLAAPADAAVGKASTTVTIRADGTDLSGTVRSPRPARCANGRTVLLIRQIGARGGGNDKRIASDTASLQGGAYRWSTGNTGIEGRFYARVKPTAACKGDTSKTVRATRND